MESMNQGESLDRAAVALLFFAAGMLLPLTASAHDGEGIIFVVAGIALALGLIPTVLILWFIKTRKLVKVLLFVPLLVIVSVVAFQIALPFLTAGEQASRQKSAKLSAEKAQQQRLILTSHPWYQAACGGRLDTLKTMAATEPPPRNDAYTGRELLPSIARECAIEKNQPATLGVLLDSLIRAYARDGKPLELYHYQELLGAAYGQVSPELVQIFADRGLTIASPELNQSPYGWKRIFGSGGAPPSKVPAERTIAMIGFVEKLGIDITEQNGGRELLAEAFRNMPAPVLHALLDRKIDPFGSNATTYKVRPYDRWIYRQFVPYADYALSKDEIAGINARLRPLTPEEMNTPTANFSGTFPISFAMRDVISTPDGGVAYFRYVLAHGARLDAADSNGRGMFTSSHPPSPQLVEELDKLSNVQLTQLANPVHADGRAGISLIKEAKEGRQKAWLDFLCRKRSLNGC